MRKLSPFEEQQMLGTKFTTNEGLCVNEKLNVNESASAEVSQFNNPEHYHQFEIDTITFIQKGFPPEVFINFAIVNIIKYLQRFPYKNGKDDILKAKDYMFRLYEFVIEKDLLK